MKALFITRYNEQGASSRCRVYQYLPHLARCGIDGEVIAEVPATVEHWRRVAAADAIFVQKRVLTLPTLLRLRRRARLLLFDFDDAIWLRRRRDNTVCGAAPRTRLRLAVALLLADQVIAGNEYLASHARRWNRRVAVLPTPVDPDHYSSALETGIAAGEDGRAGAGLRLGWVGHASNLCYLRALEPVFAELWRRFPETTLRVVCSEPYESAAIPVENVPWSLPDEVVNLRRFDIGLMPLSDDPWTRGKCGYKALQYMAVGVPVVCSPVGMNSRIVTDGDTGLHAADRRDWERQLASLLASPELRQQIGTAGQRAALREYSLNRLAPRLVELLGSATRPEGRSSDRVASARDSLPSPDVGQPSEPALTGGTAPR